MQVMHRALVLFISAIKLAFCKNDFGFCCSLHHCNFSIFVLAFDFSLLKVKVSILKYRFTWIKTQQVRHRTNRRHSRVSSQHGLKRARKFRETQQNCPCPCFDVKRCFVLLDYGVRVWGGSPPLKIWPPPSAAQVNQEWFCLNVSLACPPICWSKTLEWGLEVPPWIFGLLLPLLRWTRRFVLFECYFVLSS